MTDKSNSNTWSTSSNDIDAVIHQIPHFDQQDKENAARNSTIHQTVLLLSADYDSDCGQGEGDANNDIDCVLSKGRRQKHQRSLSSPEMDNHRDSSSKQYTSLQSVTADNRNSKEETDKPLRVRLDNQDIDMLTQLPRKLDELCWKPHLDRQQPLKSSDQRHQIADPLVGREIDFLPMGIYYQSMGEHQNMIFPNPTRFQPQPQQRRRRRWHRQQRKKSLNDLVHYYTGSDFQLKPIALRRYDTDIDQLTGANQSLGESSAAVSPPATQSSPLVDSVLTINVPRTTRPDVLVAIRTNTTNANSNTDTTFNSVASIQSSGDSLKDSAGPSAPPSTADVWENIDVDWLMNLSPTNHLDNHCLHRMDDDIKRPALPKVDVDFVLHLSTTDLDSGDKVDKLLNSPEYTVSPSAALLSISMGRNEIKQSQSDADFDDAAFKNRMDGVDRYTDNDGENSDTDRVINDGKKYRDIRDEGERPGRDIDLVLEQSTGRSSFTMSSQYNNAI